MKHISFLLLIINCCFNPVIGFAQKKVLEQNTAIEKKLLKGEIHIYSISMQKDEFSSCNVIQKGVDLAVDVISPSGEKIKTFDSPNGNDGPEEVTINALESGSYELNIYPMLDQSSITDAESRALFADQNQGNYIIESFSKLSLDDYKKKLLKEASDKIAFTKWLTENSHSLTTVDSGNGFKDLEPWKQILKNVTVVGLGESSHGTSEFFRMKHRMLEFLVNEMGYNSFYIEASMARCRYINDYVLYGKGDLDAATSIQGFTTWRVQEVRNMIEWIRMHNKSLSEEKKVKFMGYDLQINDFGWKDLKQFYNTVNPTMNTVLDSLYKESEKGAILSNGSSSEQIEGATIFKSLYKSCLNILDDMNMKAGQYQFVIGKKNFNQSLMNIKLIIQEIEAYKDGNNDRRDYYMAQNIMSLLNDEKEGAKVIVWAHNAHIEKLHYSGFGSMGYYLSQYLKQQYYAVGFEFFSGSFQSRNVDIKNSSSLNWNIINLDEPPTESLPWYFDKTGKINLFIDFRFTKPTNIVLFSKPFKMHSLGSSYSPKYWKALYDDNLENFDGMIYIKNSNAAKNIPNTAKN
jgi:erythromycin esterase